MIERDTVIESLLDTDWAPLVDHIVEHGKGFLRVTVTSNGLVLESIPPDSVHCATCQCNKLNDEANRRVLGNPRSRSWHRD